ncbi:MAG: hypothetical protein KDJ29_01990 [Hyphomicrobiales bacterium]|nr:hypothetical protein [Hyphomicrobiales bacterium]
MNILIAGDCPAALIAGLRLRLRRPDWPVSIVLRGEQPVQPAAILTNPVVPVLATGEEVIRAALDAKLHRTSGISVHRQRDGSGAEALTIPGMAYGSAGYPAMRDTILPLAGEAGCQWVHDPGTIDPGAFDLVLMSDRGLLPAAGGDAGAFENVAGGGGRLHAVFALGVEGADVAFGFAQTPEGLFSAMRIPESAQRCTLILEADVAAIEAAELREETGNLDHFCAQHFPGLTGDGAFQCKGGWQPVVTGAIASRVNGAAVLFGSAAVRLHYSCGLQARHDIEDAMALADAIVDGHADIEAALGGWQEARSKRSASFQRASAASAEWLASAARNFDQPMEQFAFGCATRSLRMGYKRVREACPEFADRVDALAAGGHVSNAPPPPMFSPYTLRDLHLPNRMVFSPMCMYSAVDGAPNNFHEVHLGARAVGGFGLVIAEMTNVTAQGRMTAGCAGMYLPEHVPAWKRVTDFTHTHTQAKIGIQLAHAGRKGSIGRSWEKYDLMREEDKWDVIAPSPIPFTPDRPLPKEMTKQDIVDTIDAFARAARMSVDAGFDMIELHMAHGYLMSEFISPLANRRGDAYGGSLPNRMRFPLEVFEAVRAQIPGGMPIAARISATDYDPDGVTPRESLEISRMLHAAGCDIIAVSTGGVTAARRPTQAQRLYQLALCEAVRLEAKVPAMTVGGLVSHTDCNMIIGSGRADLCVMARGAMNDPYFPHHAAHEQGYRFPWPQPYDRADETVIRSS